MMRHVFSYSWCIRFYMNAEDADHCEVSAGTAPEKRENKAAPNYQ